MAKGQGIGGGRPTKYKEEYCDITQYLEHCKLEPELPTICGYAVYVGVCEDTLYKWGEKHSKFSGTLREILVIEKRQLINRGLDSSYNSTIAKLLLSANHGMAEKTETKHGLTEATATLMGLIDGSSKGVLPAPEEAKDG